MQVFRKFVLQSDHYLRAGVVWITLLADMLVFAIPTIVLVAVAWRRRVSAFPATVCLSFVAFVCILFYAHYRVHPLALATLAVGFGVQTARFLSARPMAYMHVVARTTPVLAALVAVLGVAMSGWRMLAERKAMIGIPEAPEGAPNVILIVWDTARAISLSLYGDPRPTTPNLHRLAEQGVRFDRAIATSSWTLPSHSSMFTGRYADELRSTLLREPLDGKYPTLAEALRARGYATAAFTANYFYASREFGLNRGFIRYTDFSFLQELVRTSPLLGLLSADGHGLPFIGYREIIGRKRADDVNAEFLSWLEKRPNRPFFAFLNYFDAHIPYTPPAPFDRKFAVKGDSVLDVEWDGAMPVGVDTRERREALERAYAGSIAYLDDRLGALVAELNERRLLENTLLIVTSDHGETLGEHGNALGHSTGLYMTELHVPLVLVFRRGVEGGGVVRTPVTLRDIPATVWDLAGFDSNEAGFFPGTSLASYMREGHRKVARGSRSAVLSAIFPMPGWTRKDFPVSKGKMTSLVSDTLHYIRNGDGSEELYDFAVDPLEKHDLALKPERQSDLDALRAALASALVRQGSGDRRNPKSP